MGWRPPKTLASRRRECSRSGNVAAVQGNPLWRVAASKSLVAALVVCGLAILGCGSKKPARDDLGHEVSRTVDLTLVVVDDPPMSAAIERLRAEWKAQSGSSLTVAQMTAAELDAAGSLPAGADAAIYPSGQIGWLAERGEIAPLPSDFATHKVLAWSDTFELEQVAETRWGPTPYAVPFGSAVLTCYYRADLFERFHKRPPRTWAEYHALAEFFARGENLSGVELPDTWHASVEPLASGWGGRVFLARAAAYARHRDHYSTLFRIDTMEPLVGGPPFVRALEELAADAKLGPANVLDFDPSAARREFLAGRAALALALPAHAAPGQATADASPPATGFAELPGAAEVYNYTDRSWQPRKAEESRHVTLLGFAGRLGSVAAHSAQQADAFQLLAWLAGREWGTTVASASLFTTLYRRSQIRAPQPWLDPLTDAEAARQYADMVNDAMGRQAWLSAPRIPGEARYLAALDAAVAQVVRGEQTADAALASAAAAWTKITAELGLDAQRAAYRKSLGLEP